MKVDLRSAFGVVRGMHIDLGSVIVTVAFVSALSPHDTSVTSGTAASSELRKVVRERCIRRVFYRSLTVSDDPRPMVRSGSPELAVFADSVIVEPELNRLCGRQTMVVHGG